MFARQAGKSVAASARTIEEEIRVEAIALVRDEHLWPWGKALNEAFKVNRYKWNDKRSLMVAQSARSHPASASVSLKTEPSFPGREAANTIAAKTGARHRCQADQDLFGNGAVKYRYGYGVA